MVCRNCGADLKPGIKYCLECGSYIDEEEDEDELDTESTSNDSPSGASLPRVRRRKRLNLTLTDYLIYAGLLLIMIVSIIVIIVTLVKNNNRTSVPDTLPTATASETPKEDQTLTIDNYSVIVPGSLVSTVQGSILYISDEDSYKFSFQNKEDDFDKYVKDQSILKKQLEKSKYEVLSVSEKTINNRLFLLYELKVDGSSKVLYLTKINTKYTTMGTIDVLSGGNWEDALPIIDSVCNSISFEGK